MTKKQIVAFQKKVWGYYFEHGRHGLSWRFGVGKKSVRSSREILDPYRIFVSELMLQQTQVDRVIPKYHAFVEKFPTAVSLAKAKQSDIVRLWQGLGYNRRALYLKKACEEIVQKRAGQFPVTFEELRTLSGIGPYTAGAICAFAYNQPVIFIETNIRSVFLHEFFPGKSDISDTDIIPLIEKTLDIQNPREWYWALMDYGAFLKKSNPNPNRRSMHHTVQSKFVGSDRQIRGAILVLFSVKVTLSQTDIIRLLPQFEKFRVETQVQKLLSEGFLISQKDTFSLRD